MSGCQTVPQAEEKRVIRCQLHAAVAMSARRLLCALTTAVELRRKERCDAATESSAVVLRLASRSET